MEGDYRDWHRLFGLMLMDFFSSSPFTVEVEKDLSQKKQLLDVVILRKEGPFDRRLPDGFDNLVRHNLITFKSYQEVLNDWTLKELTGHCVNYIKQVSPSVRDLLPEEDFRMYAVTARFPQGLASQMALTELQQGVYQVQRGTDVIRVIVLRQLPQTEHNAMLHLFSAEREQVLYGAQHYQRRSEETSTFINHLFQRYQQEGVNMPCTIEDFRRDYVRRRLKDLTPQERVEGLSLADIVAALSYDQRINLLNRLGALDLPRSSEAPANPPATE